MIVPRRKDEEEKEEEVLLRQETAQTKESRKQQADKRERRRKKDSRQFWRAGPNCLLDEAHQRKLSHVESSGDGHVSAGKPPPPTFSPSLSSSEPRRNQLNLTTLS